MHWTNLRELDSSLRLTEKRTMHHPSVIRLYIINNHDVIAACSLLVENNNFKLFRRVSSTLARLSNIILNLEMLHSYRVSCVAQSKEVISLSCILLQGFLRRMGEEVETETQEMVDTLPVPKPEEAVKKEGKHSI